METVFIRNCTRNNKWQIYIYMHRKNKVRSLSLPVNNDMRQARKGGLCSANLPVPMYSLPDALGTLLAICFNTYTARWKLLLTSCLRFPVSRSCTCFAYRWHFSHRRLLRFRLSACSVHSTALGLLIFTISIISNHWYQNTEAQVRYPCGAANFPSSSLPPQVLAMCTWIHRG